MRDRSKSAASLFAHNAKSPGGAPGLGNNL